MNSGAQSSTEAGLSQNSLLQGFSESLNLPTAHARRTYLELIARGEISPMVVVSGLPGSGKTTALSLLQDAGTDSYAPVIRLMPRARRESDPETDLPWAPNVLDVNGQDLGAPKAVIFSNVKYQGYYGFPGMPILQAVNRGDTPVMLVTSYVEMVQLAEALHNHIPLAPLVTVRIEVPQDLLPGRINRRAGAHPDEHRERIERLSGLVRADLLQAPLLHKVYGTRVILNVKQQEIDDFGYCSAQIKPLTPDVLAALVVEASVAARERATLEARDILQTRQLTYGSRSVPDPIIDVLDRVLLPTAAERLSPEGVTAGERALVIKAGLAAAIYLGEQGRVVSPDIDYTLVESPSAKRQMELLMEALCSELPQWSDGKDKAVYHCEGLKGVATAQDGTQVELDAILITRVQPHPSGFVFVCTHDEHDLFHRRTVQTPGGHRFGMIPPEQLCIEKLLAGRGPEIHKFDLFDASGLLAMYQLNPNLIKKMVEMQRFRNDLDEDARGVLEQHAWKLSPEVLMQLGIADAEIQSIALSMGQLTGDEWAPYPSEDRSLSASALKQLAFCSAVETSLKRIEQIIEQPIFTIGGDKVSIHERFGKESVLMGISYVRAQMKLHAGYYVGMNDTFVRRTLTTREQEDAFFEHLESQRTRLSRG